MNMENFTSVFNSADGPTSIFVAGKTPEIMGVLIAIVVVGVIISLFGLKLVRVLSAMMGLGTGAVIGAVILHKTVLGNYCLFCGTSALALNRSGVDVKKLKIVIYAICGLCAGIAGMIVTARLNSAEPLAGQGYEMDAIAAAVLGGTSMQGGKGNVAGTVVACLILNILKNGLVLLSVSSHYQEVLTGVILVIAVLISESNRRKRSEV